MPLRCAAAKICRHAAAGCAAYCAARYAQAVKRAATRHGKMFDSRCDVRMY